MLFFLAATHIYSQTNTITFPTTYISERNRIEPNCLISINVLSPFKIYPYKLFPDPYKTPNSDPYKTPNSDPYKTPNSDP